MKYIVLVADGAADWPIESLGNHTILESAKIPNMHWLATHGKMGRFKTIPDSMAPGSEVANMSIMGYRPETDLTGRGALEALSSGVSLAPNEIAFRCNIITIQNGNIDDYSSGHITTPEAKELIETINSVFHEKGVDFFPGIQYRHILRLAEPRFSEAIICTPPHDQLGKSYKQFLIRPKDPKDVKAQATADYLNQLIEKSAEILAKHPVNQKRIARGNKPATHIWPWSGGKRPAVKPFKEKYGLTGVCISAVDLIFGIGVAAGLEPIHVEGATGLLDTNYQGKVNAALTALETHDFALIHVEAPDEMGHAGDPNKKIQAVEDFDAKIVGPILQAKEQFKEGLTIVVLPDHPTPVKIRTHARDPVPFVVYQTGMEKKTPHPKRQFIEKNAENGELGFVENGEDFIRLLLRLKTE